MNVLYLLPKGFTLDFHSLIRILKPHWESWHKSALKCIYFSSETLRLGNLTGKLAQRENFEVAAFRILSSLTSFLINFYLYSCDLTSNIKPRRTYINTNYVYSCSIKPAEKPLVGFPRKLPEVWCGRKHIVFLVKIQIIKFTLNMYVLTTPIVVYGGSVLKPHEKSQVSPAAADAKSLQSCLTLCDPTDGSPPGSPIPGILQARPLEWVAISFSSPWKWKVKVQSVSHVWLFATPWTAAHQAPPSMGFSRQEYWSGLPMPSPRFHLGLLNQNLHFNKLPRYSLGLPL